MFDLQKASMLKRVPAWMLDAVLFLCLAAGFMALLGSGLQVDKHTKELDAIYVKYEETYDISFTITQEDYQKLNKDEKAAYDAAADALAKDVEAQRAYEMVLNMTVLTLSISLLATYFILEFLIPLWLKNGQTLGKKVFSIGVMRTDGVKITPFMLFARTILGKYTLETMIPVMLLMMLLFGVVGLEGVIIIGLILLLQVIIMIATRTNSAIHDLVACTVTVDLASQMIFDSPEARLEYQKKLQADEAANADY